MIDIMENKIFGPLIRKGMEEGHAQGLAEGFEQGIEQGLEKGEKKGMAEILQAQLEGRFGELPSWAQRKLEVASRIRLKDWSVRVLSANSLEEVFQ